MTTAGSTQIRSMEDQHYHYCTYGTHTQGKFYSLLWKQRICLELTASIMLTAPVHTAFYLKKVWNNMKFARCHMQVNYYLILHCWHNALIQIIYQVAWKLIWISGIMALGSKLWPCNQEVVELSPGLTLNLRRLQRKYSCALWWILTYCLLNNEKCILLKKKSEKSMQYAHTQKKTLNAALLLHYHFTLPFKGLLSERLLIFLFLTCYQSCRLIIQRIMEEKTHNFFY